MNLSEACPTQSASTVCLSSKLEFVHLLRSPGIDSQPGGIDSLESIPGLLKRLQIRALIYKVGVNMSTTTVHHLLYGFRILDIGLSNHNNGTKMSY